ncbi:AMP-binding protein [Pseudorhodoplanes sinuspersici]|nr:class I adenylate-forming enzyme family protein [Pseudorhodoplanes sinuspersici]RKE73488.1 acyl-CoA synthetase (AMP-forming)/AMP-acid ligase II [Pseudorhodoplanes sinuspersici]
MHAPISMAGRSVRSAATTIDSLFRANAARRPDADAVIDSPDRERVIGQPPRHLTYAQADRAVEAIATRLRQIGLPAGTVVGLQMPNIVESVLTLLAITRAGMVPAPLPLLWRRADCVAALSRAGARAIITYGHVDDMDHAQLALGIAAELFPIRVVCGFGCGRVDGIVPFDDCLSADIESTHELDVSLSESSPAAAITFDMTADGPVAVLRDHAQLLAGGVLVQHRATIQPRAAIVSTIPATSFAGLATSFVPWLLCTGTLILHHPFDPDALARQIAEHDGNILVVPDALLLPLTQSETLDTTRSLKSIIALWRSPDRVAASSQWPADAPNLVDVAAFGEAGLLASVRAANGRAAPWPTGNIVVAENGHDITLGRVAQTVTGTLGLGGLLAASPLRLYDPEPTEAPDTGADLVDTGYSCRLTPNDETLVITASPVGLVNVGGYRFAMHDLQLHVRDIDDNGVIAAFPHALTGYRLAGHATNSEVVRAKLEESGSNPLISHAFHDRLPS